jgi:hypothetical protein
MELIQFFYAKKRGRRQGGRLKMILGGHFNHLNGAVHVNSNNNGYQKNQERGNKKQR